MSKRLLPIVDEHLGYRDAMSDIGVRFEQRDYLLGYKRGLKDKAASVEVEITNFESEYGLHTYKDYALIKKYTDFIKEAVTDGSIDFEEMNAQYCLDLCMEAFLLQDEDDTP